jgi:site-specific recombinase XerD
VVDWEFTVGELWDMNGASLLEIADILGHKTLEMVKRYSHLSEDHKADVLERMNKKVFG